MDRTAVEQRGGWRGSLQAGPGNQDREAGDGVAGETPHGIAGTDQHGHARLGHPLDPVHPFLRQPLKRQPEHPVAALLPLQLHPATSMEQQDLEFRDSPPTDVGPEGG
jgi:hypothetical protein